MERPTTDGFKKQVAAAAAMTSLLALAQPQPAGSTVFKYLLTACDANDPATSFPQPCLVAHVAISVKDGRTGVRWGVKSGSEAVSAGVQQHFGACLGELLNGRLAGVVGE